MDAYARYTVVHSPGSLPFPAAALWANTWDYAPAATLTGLVLPLMFPEGRLLSPRWRPALWAALAFIPLLFAGMAFIPQDMGGYFHHLPNPYAVVSFDRPFEAMQVLSVACGLAAAGAAAASVALRWRRAGRAGRQQLKWFLVVLPDFPCVASAAIRSDGTLLTWGDDIKGGLDTSTCCLSVNPTPSPGRRPDLDQPGSIRRDVRPRPQHRSVRARPRAQRDR